MYIQSFTGQVLWPLLCAPKGFMPSVFKPNLIFLVSFANFGNVLSTLMPSIATISMWYPTYFGLVCNLGTTMFCSPPTYASDLSIPFLFGKLS